MNPIGNLDHRLPLRHDGIHQRGARLQRGLRIELVDDRQARVPVVLQLLPQAGPVPALARALGQRHVAAQGVVDLGADPMHFLAVRQALFDRGLEERVAQIHGTEEHVGADRRKQFVIPQEARPDLRGLSVGGRHPLRQGPGRQQPDREDAGIPEQQEAADARPSTHAGRHVGHLTGKRPVGEGH